MIDAIVQWHFGCSSRHNAILKTVLPIRPYAFSSQFTAQQEILLDSQFFIDFAISICTNGRNHSIGVSAFYIKAVFDSICYLVLIERPKDDDAIGFGKATLRFYAG